MKTGLKVAAAIMVMISGTAIAAPFSVSSADMREGDALAQRHCGEYCPTGDKLSRWRRRQK